MSKVALASEAHKHRFKVKYKLIEDKIVFYPICQCAGCEVKATINFDGYRMQVTFVGNGTPVSYTAVLMEQS